MTAKFCKIKDLLIVEMMILKICTSPTNHPWKHPCTSLQTSDNDQVEVQGGWSYMRPPWIIHGNTKECQKYKNSKRKRTPKNSNTKLQNRYQDVERGRSYEATMKYGPKKGCPRESKKLVVGVKHSLDASATSYIPVLSNSSSNFSSDTSLFCATSPAQQISPPPIYISSPNRSTSINFCHLRLIPISPMYLKKSTLQKCSVWLGNSSCLLWVGLDNYLGQASAGAPIGIWR